MAKYHSSYDFLHSFWNEQNLSQLNDAAYAEELQLQEALKMSVISSQTNKDKPSSSTSSMPPQTSTTNLDYDTDDGDEENDDIVDDSDEYDEPDSRPKSHKMDNNSKWFTEFFKELELLSVEEINGHKSSRKLWHCPACKGGPGATKWFRSLQDLITHAKTIGARRVKLHREFAKVLEEEIERKCASVTTNLFMEKVVPKWKGLKEEEKEHGIVWPPTVVIRNTSIWINNKWIGLENQDLFEQFSSYTPIKAHNFYGPQGHRGISLLIFESSVAGYLDAERLHKSFSEEGLGRNARNVEENQLYGYMAVKEDMNFLNQGKSKIKYAIRSYEDVIINQIRSLSEDSGQLIRMTDLFVEEKMRVDTLDESIRVLRKKMDQKTEEVTKLRQILQQQIEEHEEEMEFQENFYKDQIKAVEVRKQEDTEAMQLELPDQE